MSAYVLFELASGTSSFAPAALALPNAPATSASVMALWTMEPPASSCSHVICLKPSISTLGAEGPRSGGLLKPRPIRTSCADLKTASRMARALTVAPAT